MQTEYTGRLLSDGHLLVSPEIIGKFEIGEILRVRLAKLDDQPVTAKHGSISPECHELLQLFENAGSGKEMTPAAKRFLERMEHADTLGVTEDPRELSHAILAEERMEKKYPCTE